VIIQSYAGLVNKMADFDSQCRCEYINFYRV
jgi:hypothetical protein